METIGVRDLRQRASEILKEVEAGTAFTVTVSGRPVAKLVPYDTQGPQTWVPWNRVAELLQSPIDASFEADRRSFGTIGIDDPWTR